jgi:putative ABC transport system permease protein
MGARPLFICGMLVFEAVVMASLGAVLGVIMLYAALSGAQSSIDSNFGIWLPIEAPNLRELAVLFIVVCAGAIVSLIPALRAYKLSVADGMIVHT